MNALPRIAAWLLAIALVAFPVVAVLNGWLGGAQWPMRHLSVTGEFRLVDERQVRAAVLPMVRQGFFAVDMEQVRHRIAVLPWVEDAQVRKRWPDRLEVSLTEYRPVAHWGEDRLLAESGALFKAPDVALPRLPRFDGPESRATEVQTFHGQARAMFLGMGLQVSRVELSARGGWQLTLSDGLEIAVGRNDTEHRLARFARLLPKIRSGSDRQLVRADLRYTNGFALVWQDASDVPAATQMNMEKGNT